MSRPPSLEVEVEWLGFAMPMGIPRHLLGTLEDPRPVAGGGVVDGVPCQHDGADPIVNGEALCAVVVNLITGFEMRFLGVTAAAAAHLADTLLGGRMSFLPCSETNEPSGPMMMWSSKVSSSKSAASLSRWVRSMS